jgi:hypothetical protein
MKHDTHHLRMVGGIIILVYKPKYAFFLTYYEAYSRSTQERSYVSG